VLVVERNPALAQALAQTIQARFGAAWSVSYARDSHALAPRYEASEIVVINATDVDSATGDDIQRFSAPSERQDTQTIYVTGATSYQLSQRGINGGVVLREPHCLDEIVSLVAEALAHH
jgi:chromosome condensin MukBEF complex kleisin-like MukF subunit